MICPNVHAERAEAQTCRLPHFEGQIKRSVKHKARPYIFVGDGAFDVRGSVTIKRYCSECRAKRDNENRRNARRANRRRNGAKPKGFIPDCVPPYDCMNCRYSDCVRNTGVTRAETECRKSDEK